MGSSQSQHQETPYHCRDLPKPGGHYYVGFVDLMSDKYHPDGIFVRLHYPVTLKVGESPKYNVKWLPHERYTDGFADVMGVNRTAFKWVTHYLHNNDHVMIPAMPEHPITTEGGQLPPIILSHGLGAAKHVYTAIATELASQGFLVANVEHRDHSAAITYRLKDGKEEWIEHAKKVIPSMEKPWNDESWVFRNQQILQRGKECSAVADFLADLNEGKDVANIAKLTNFDIKSLQGRIDFSKLAVTGHSFGGGTTVQTMALDSRFKAAVAWDAWVLPATAEDRAKPTQPLLFINMDHFNWIYNLRETKKIVDAGKSLDPPAERHLVTIRGGVHNNQCDVTFLMGTGFTAKKLKMIGEIDAYLCHKINMDLTLAFLRNKLDIDHHESFEDVMKRYADHVVEGTTIDLANIHWED